MIDRLIRNCDVLIFNGDTPEVVLNQDITIEKSLIKKIGKTGSLEVDQKTEIVDAKGLLAIPGLINTHAHIPMVLMRNLAEDVSVESCSTIIFSQWSLI